MNITPRFMDELRSRITISELVGKSVRLTRAGREFKGCCPFHKEKTPSFYVNDDKQFYHCFGCGAHGDIIGWAMQHDNRSFPEAVEVLAGLAGLDVPQSAPQDIRKAREEKNLYQMMDDASLFLEEELHALPHKTAKEYILGRGLGEETLSAFRVGFASNDRQALYNHLIAKGYNDTQMIEGGLIRKDKNGTAYAFFRDRIMFPVTDKRGRIVAFGGRILPDHLRPPERGDFKAPKYINSIDTPLFHKGRMLYGAAHAGYAAGEGEPLIVTEGYMDVIACWQAGLKGAVAPLGTALTEDQIIALWRMIPADTKVPVLCFDGDTAGQRAAVRAMERALPLLKAGHSLKIMFLPAGEDPDTYIQQKGGAGFRTLLSQAHSLVDFLFESEIIGKSFTTPEERAALNARLDTHITRIPDRDVQYYYRGALRDKTRALFQTATFKGKKTYKNPSKFEKSTPLQPPHHAKDHLLARILLAAVILRPELFHDVEERLSRLPLSHPGLESLRAGLFSACDSEIKLDFTELKSHLISVGLEGDLAYTLNDSVLTHAGFIRADEEYHSLLQSWNALWQMMETQAEQRDKIQNRSLTNQ